MISKSFNLQTLQELLIYIFEFNNLVGLFYSLLPAKLRVQFCLISSSVNMVLTGYQTKVIYRECFVDHSLSNTSSDSKLFNEFLLYSTKQLLLLLTSKIKLPLTSMDVVGLNYV